MIDSLSSAMLPSTTVQLRWISCESPIWTQVLADPILFDLKVLHNSAARAGVPQDGNRRDFMEIYNIICNINIIIIFILYLYYIMY